ncbi:uncharacterized protein Z518_07881 [Rhinocladiella mackenziei CBS 650.93]|uniref:Major facilitator superfamily (MFS) profile domain-containing protein n=1 Tax=Rhinocladiella mackenziei CBS 650.93 TaxID=1442369 RepID=A0A0D2FIY3_9EURO|nr:uncharacterized protein Z518_07881 [Rhinocladiella mackenziei CBS 650.93]KIX01942.1 hypothetical protein Z518_07881 [Rhinocladiella mackenziei CBS 650.93]
MLGLSKYPLFCLAYIMFGSSFYGYDSGRNHYLFLAYESFLTYFKFNANTIGSFNSAYYAACVVGSFR